ncbi:hypothetical protein [Nitrosomonas sp. PY1]|uniref:hypothetical protein n=1 Tax=Nitrosomonas sp. PY1 TaxID=1803906 RepID=UPI001FC8498F|nr:hypothetical protein [Nitrosomonas sp. PY1]
MPDCADFSAFPVFTPPKQSLEFGSTFIAATPWLFVLGLQPVVPHRVSNIKNKSLDDMSFERSCNVYDIGCHIKLSFVG